MRVDPTLQYRGRACRRTGASAINRRAGASLTIVYRERHRDRARKIAPHHLRFFFQKPKAILRR
jgi:hypothetical protein